MAASFSASFLFLFIFAFFSGVKKSLTNRSKLPFKLVLVQSGGTPLPSLFPAASSSATICGNVGTANGSKLRR